MDRLEHPPQHRLEPMLQATQCYIHLRAGGWEKVILIRFTRNDNRAYAENVRIERAPPLWGEAHGGERSYSLR